jgi:hypothetical protein
LLSLSPKSCAFPSHIKNLKIKIYKTVILSVALYRCETWALNLRKESRLRVSENRVLRKIFGPKREEDGSWRKLHNDELDNPYFSPNIVRVIKSRKMRWAGHVARMGEGEVFIGFLLGNSKGKDHWEDLVVGGRITLSWTLGREGSMGLTGFGCLKVGSSGGFCEHGNEPSGSVKKAGYFLTNRVTINL